VFSGWICGRISAETACLDEYNWYLYFARYLREMQSSVLDLQSCFLISMSCTTLRCSGRSGSVNRVFLATLARHLSCTFLSPGADSSRSLPVSRGWCCPRGGRRSGKRGVRVVQAILLEPCRDSREVIATCSPAYRRDVAKRSPTCCIAVRLLRRAPPLAMTRTNHNTSSLGLCAEMIFPMFCFRLE
jgi:hypothetical protein